MIHSRRSLPLAIGALISAVLLTGCGFDQPTNRINQVTHGSTVRGEASVDAVNVLLVAAAPDSGTLVGHLVNKDHGDSRTVVGITGDDLEISEFEPIELAAGRDALLQDAGIRVDGDFDAGQYLAITLHLDNDEEVDIRLPVATACDELDGMDDAPHAGDDEPDEQHGYECGTAETPDAGH